MLRTALSGVTSPLMVAICLPTVLSASQPPGLSPAATVTQVVGVSEISVSYSRPSVKERSLWGELVPWDQVWRTGANEATTLTISDDAEVEGRNLPAGTYALFTIPGEGEWTVVFNRAADQWGAFEYNSSLDALRVRVQPRQAPHQETFQVSFPDVGTDTAILRLHWGTVAVSFAIQFDVQRLARERARAFVEAAGPEEGRDIWNWANYFYQNDYNVDEALSWAAALAATTPVYWTHALHARLLARTGESGAALDAATLAMQRARQESDQPGVSADADLLRDEMTRWSSDLDE